MSNRKPFRTILGRASAYLMCLVAILMSDATRAQTPVNPSVGTAIYLAEVGQPTKAIEEMNQAIQSNPADATLHYYLGYIYLKLNDRAKAAASFDKGAALNEKDLINYAGKGRISLLEGKIDDAKLQFEKANIAKTKNAEVLKAIAEAYLIDNKYSVEAINLLKRAKSAANTDPEVEVLFGDAYLLQNNGGLAADSYERAAKLRPTMAKAPYKEGLLFERSKNNDLAVENLNKAIQVDTKYAPAYKELCEVYYLMNKGEEALKAIETYRTLVENPSTSDELYAFVLALAKKYKQANEIFAKLITDPAVRVVTIRFYANSLKEDGDFQKAREVFDMFFAKAKKESIEAKDYNDYAQVLAKLKQDGAAIEAYKKSLALKPDQGDILQSLGDTYYRLKDWPNAIDAYKKLIALHKEPKSLDQFSIGRAYYNNNQLIEADTAFTILTRLQPEMVVGYKWKADTESRIDSTFEMGLARPTFEKVLEKALTNPDKNKKEIISSYKYLSYFYYQRGSGSKKEAGDLEKARDYYEKLLVLTPDDAEVKKALEILKNPQQPQQAKSPKK